MLVAFQFTRPIRTLESSFGRVVDGDLDVRLAPRREDEVGRLTNSFNEMVARLRETREMERRLTETERLAAVGQLAAGVAHEVRNPLNAMRLTMQQLRDKHAPEGAEGTHFERYVGMVTGELERLERLVSTFLDFSKDEELALGDVDVSGQLRDTVELFTPEAERKGVNIAVESGDALMVRGDRERLPTVWNNLVANALQATEAGGGVTVIAPPEGGDVVVDVRDEGSGIAEEDLPHIWEPFFSGRAGGTGLGLSLARSIVERHGGAVEAESRPGEGTSVRVRLPRRTGEESRP